MTPSHEITSPVPAIAPGDSTARPRDVTVQPRAIPFRTLALAWCITATVAVIQSAIQLALIGDEGQPWLLVALTFVGWLVWAPLTPAIVTLTRRFPLQRSSLGTALVVHALAAAVCATLVSVFWEVLAETAARSASSAVPLGGAYMRWRMLLNPAGHAMIGGVTYAGIVAAITALDTRERAHRTALDAAQLERDVAEAREQAIKAQIHPHFLFNTLHAVSVLVTEQPAIARAMVVHLADFLRATLARAAATEVTLREELDLIDHYLSVEQLRFGDRLIVRIDVTDEALAALVPDLVLQPLVENAIKHGISSRPEALHVTIRARHVDRRLVLQVDDDGASTTAPPPREGRGLGITRRRLAHLYGDDQEVALATRLEGGMRATISLPYHVEPVAGPPVPAAAERQHA